MTPALTRRLYVIAWLMLGSIALVYLLTLFQSMREPAATAGTSPTPSLFKRSPLAERKAEPSDPGLSRALARMNSEIDTLKASLEAARKENTALKAHIKTLETTYGPSTASLPPPQVKPDPAYLEKQEITSSAPAPKIEVSLLPMPSDGFENDDFPEAPLPIAGLQEPKRTLFAVELANGLKADAVEMRWSEFKKRHPKLLGKLQPMRVGSGIGMPGGPAPYKLVVGPFKNAAAAARLCARLSAAGTKCEGTVFTGTPVGDIAAR